MTRQFKTIFVLVLTKMCIPEIPGTNRILWLCSSGMGVPIIWVWCVLKWSNKMQCQKSFNVQLVANFFYSWITALHFFYCSGNKNQILIHILITTSNKHEITIIHFEKSDALKTEEIVFIYSSYNNIVTGGKNFEKILLEKTYQVIYQNVSKS